MDNLRRRSGDSLSSITNYCHCSQVCSCPLRLNEEGFTTMTSLETQSQRNSKSKMVNTGAILIGDLSPKLTATVSNSTSRGNNNYLANCHRNLIARRHHRNLFNLTSRNPCEAAQPVAADRAPVFSFSEQPNYPLTAPLSVAGPSLCPLVTVCQCKWSQGKQIANCEKRNLAQIPSQLPSETQVLEMDGNNINQLVPRVFQDKHLTNLQKLYLRDCRIANVADEAFSQLTILRELDLSRNNIRQVPVKALEQLQISLRKLNLAMNPIETIEPGSFVSLKNLEVLDLSNCHLRLLKPDAFFGLNLLKELHLQDNKLTQLPMTVMKDLKDYSMLDLFNNPWHCDCELRQTIDWMSRHHIQQTIFPTCTTPARHKDIRWHIVKPEEYICPPVVINKQNELIVGVGSNISLSCTAQGSSPLTFVWFQDEKNLTTPRINSSEPPASTKLLEEKRYEIAEEIGPPGHPNITTSILYLFNLKLTDTSLFLCWVENAAGYTIANISLVVSDSMPAQILGGTITENTFLRMLGLSQGDAQSFGLLTIGFLLVAVVISIILLKQYLKSHSSKSSQTSDLKDVKSNVNENHVNLMAASNKFAQNRSSMMDSEDSANDEDTDDRSSSGSGSSCHKKKPKNSADLDGFIEHMRSGIINMDYHSMSPVIQFNNTLKSNKSNQNQQQLNYHHQQPMHHFTSASGASYYGNGSSSMATTTSDLSPSSGSGNTITTSNQFVNNNNNLQPHLTNCDLHNQFNDISAPPTNTTTTSYTSDYQSGYSEETTLAPNMMPTIYYEGGGTLHAYHPATGMFTPSGHLIIPDGMHQQSAGRLTGQSPMMNLSQQQQQQHRVMGMIQQGQMMPPNRRQLDEGQYPIL